MDAAVHARGERAALEAMAADPAAVETIFGGAGFDDPRDRAGIDRPGSGSRGRERGLRPPGAASAAPRCAGTPRPR